MSLLLSIGNQLVGDTVVLAFTSPADIRLCLMPYISANVAASHLFQHRLFGDTFNVQGRHLWP